MEKEPQPESLPEVTIKADYAPSEVYSSEPPPAYHRPQSSAVQVARIIAVTVVVVSVIIGGFMLASAYVTSRSSCKQLEQELEFLAETADRMQPLQPEALVQDEEKTKIEEAPKKATKSQDETDMSENSVENDIQVLPNIAMKLKFPMQLILNELAEILAEKQERAETNCVIEKKTAEQVVDHMHRPMPFPFMGPRPRQEHITGERIAIVCKSGSKPRLAEILAEKQERAETNCVIEKKTAEQVVDHMHRPMPFPFMGPRPRQEHITGERIAIVCKSGSKPSDFESREEPSYNPVVIPMFHQQYETHMPQQSQSVMFQARPHPVDSYYPQQQEPTGEEYQRPFPQPNPLIGHIIRHIIAQRMQEEAALRDQQQNQEVGFAPMGGAPQYPSKADILRNTHLPIPEEILQQVDRLPNTGGVIIAVSGNNAQQGQQQEEGQQNTQETKDDDIKSLPLPVQITMNVMKQIEEQAQSAPEADKPKMEMQEQENAQETNNNDDSIRSLPLPVQLAMSMMQQMERNINAPQEVHDIKLLNFDTNTETSQDEIGTIFKFESLPIIPLNTNISNKTSDLKAESSSPEPVTTLNNLQDTFQTIMSNMDKMVLNHDIPDLTPKIFKGELDADGTGKINSETDLFKSKVDSNLHSTEKHVETTTIPLNIKIGEKDKHDIEPVSFDSNSLKSVVNSSTKKEVTTPEPVKIIVGDDASVYQPQPVETHSTEYGNSENSNTEVSFMPGATNTEN